MTKFLNFAKRYFFSSGRLRATGYGDANGATVNNFITVNSWEGGDEDHTYAHEVGHVFLKYDVEVNPETPEQHDAAGGIFQYMKKDENGDITKPLLPVNQQNIDLILKTVPETNKLLPPSNVPIPPTPGKDSKTDNSDKK